MKLNHWHDVRDWYRAFLDAGTRADIMPLKYDWSDYKTVVLPTVLMLSAVDTRRLADFAAAGGRVVVGYATGLIDENFHTWLGGYPGAGNGLLRDMLGIRGEEFNILGSGVEGEPEAIRLGAGGEVALEDAAALNGATTRLWQNDVTVTGDRTQVLAMYAGEEADEWELDGMAAVTRNPYGAGEAYFVGCDLDVADLTKLIPDISCGTGTIAAIASQYRRSAHRAQVCRRRVRFLSAARQEGSRIAGRRGRAGRPVPDGTG